MGYFTPADVSVSDDRAAHLARGSKEPGTDYMTAYGTDLRAPGDGRVIGIDHSNAGAEGRRLTFLMDNGEVIDWIHLAGISATPNQRVTAGQVGIARSGASGFGDDWYYGAHLHVTRRARIGLPYTQTLDFEEAIGGEPASTQEEDDMFTDEDRARMVRMETWLRGDGGVDALQELVVAMRQLFPRIRGEKTNVDMMQDVLGQVEALRDDLKAAVDKLAA